MMHLLSVDPVALTAKPKTPDEIKRVSIRINNNEACLSISKLASLISNGHTICPSTFNVNPATGRKQRRDELFSQSSLVLLDFDHGLPHADQLSHSPAIIYHSFSSTPAATKGRAVFTLSRSVHALAEYRHIVKVLMELNPTADQSCKDSSRLFYGSNQACVLVDESAEPIDVDQILLSYKPPAPPVPSGYVAPDCGDEEAQKQIFRRMSSGKREANLKYIKGILERIKTHDGSDGSSRYEVVSKAAMTLLTRDYLIPSVARLWIADAVHANPHFADWDHDLTGVLDRCMEWALPKRGV